MQYASQIGRGVPESFLILWYAMYVRRKYPWICDSDRRMEKLNKYYPKWLLNGDFENKKNNQKRTTKNHTILPNEQLNWVEFHPLYNLTNQGQGPFFFIAQNGGFCMAMNFMDSHGFPKLSKVRNLQWERFMVKKQTKKSTKKSQG